MCNESCRSTKYPVLSVKRVARCLGLVNNAMGVSNKIIGVGYTLSRGFSIRAIQSILNLCKYLISEVKVKLDAKSIFSVISPPLY